MTQYITSARQPTAGTHDFPANAAAAPNPHRRSGIHWFPAGSFFGGFRTPAPLPQPALAPARHPKPFPKKRPSSRGQQKD